MITVTMPSRLLLAATAIFSRRTSSRRTLTLPVVSFSSFPRPPCSLSYRQRTFPLEIRALSRAFFYAVGTGVVGASFRVSWDS